MTRRILLFFFGVLLNLTALLLRYEQQVPLIDHSLCGRVNCMRLAFNKLFGLPLGYKNISTRYRAMVYGDGRLQVNDKGFQELSSLFINDLRRKEPKFFSKTGSGEMSLDNFRTKISNSGFLKMEYSGLPGNGTGLGIPNGNNKINAYLVDLPEEYAAFYAYSIDKEIDDERRRVVFRWASFLFFLGTFIQIFQVNWKDRS